MNHPLRFAFFALVIRPLMMIVLGMNVRRAEDLPESGPAILVANHNSHLDVFALMHVLGLRRLAKVRPVAAADYFLTRPLRRWFATRIVGIIPIDRKNVRREKGVHPLDGISDALADDCIVLLFPEGSRGEPEKRDAFQSGIAHLARRHRSVPVTPVFLHGLGKALPKGEAVLVPFFVDLFVGKALPQGISKQEFMEALDQQIAELQRELPQTIWDAPGDKSTP